MSHRPSCDGRSLLGWLDGGRPDWRDAAFMEFDLSHPLVPTRFQRAWGLAENRCNAAIYREERWKYVHFGGGIAPMLFDREADPDETVNLADDRAAAGEVSRLRAAMLDRRMERADRRPTGHAIGA